MTDSRTVYAFQWCYSMLESDYVVESLHTTKAGAYRAMRSVLLARVKEYAFNRSVDRFDAKGAKPFRYERWRVQPMSVEQE